MMKKFLILTLALILAISAFSCKKTEDNEDDGGFYSDLDISEIESDSLGIEISVPENWQVSHSDYLGTEVRHYTAPPSDNRDAFLESISITTEEKTGTVEEYITANLKNLEAFYADFKTVEERQSLEASGLPAEKLTYSYSMGTFNVVCAQYFVFDGDKVYIVLCTSDKDDFEEYKDIFASSFETFKIN